MADEIKVVVRNVITEKDVASGIAERPVGWCYSMLLRTWFHPRYVMGANQRG